MNTLASVLASLAGPLVIRALKAIGIGVITYAGLQAAVTAALTAAKGAMGGVTGAIAQIAAMSGIFTGLGIVAGGITAGVTLVALERFGRVAS